MLCKNILFFSEVEGSLAGLGGRLTTVRCFPAVLRLFVELLVASQHTASGQTVLVPVLLRLLHMLRSSHATATAACKQVFLMYLASLNVILYSKLSFSLTH